MENGSFSDGGYGEGIVKEISTILTERALRGELKTGLSGGLGGAILLHDYLYRDRTDSELRERLESMLDIAVSYAAEARQLHLYQGALGVGWLLSHLQSHGRFEFDLSELDSCVLDALDNRWVGHFDIVTGLAGIGLYGLERMPDRVGSEIVERSIDCLAAIAKVDSSGVYWETPLELIHPWWRNECVSPLVDYGMAHGVTGVLAFLCAAIKRGLRSCSILDLLDQGVHFLSTRIVERDGRLLLPSNNQARRHLASRLAWCYNEMGAAYVMLAAGRVRNRGDWECLAINVLDGARKIRPRQIQEAGLCHGAAGVGVMYLAISQLREDPQEYVCESTKWIKRALALRGPANGQGGFCTKMRLNKDEPLIDVPSPALLEGGAGVALAALTVPSVRKCGWARFLGLDFDVTP